MVVIALVPVVVIARVLALRVLVVGLSGAAGALAVATVAVVTRATITAAVVGPALVRAIPAVAGVLVALASAIGGARWAGLRIGVVGMSFLWVGVPVLRVGACDERRRHHRDKQNSDDQRCDSRCTATHA